MEQYVWLCVALFFLAVWILIYCLSDKAARRDMWVSSLIMAPFGLSEPLFVPEYWSPPSLFNLALTTGFDIESIIFMFGVCGVAGVLYQLLFRLRLASYRPARSTHRRLHIHIAPLVLLILCLLVLPFISPLNPIYCGLIGGILGCVWVAVFRKDLIVPMFGGGILFALLYFLAFQAVVLFIPSYIESVWNLSALSGILFIGVPLEEIVWGFSMGVACTSFYEYLFDKRLVAGRKR
ncbi:MAG: hypothetical protein KBD16_03785 [Candidatus Pacebacteria bacterium]|nr:hypothetical protein [Candidatus Paceibacterota bacterium]